MEYYHINYGINYIQSLFNHIYKVERDSIILFITNFIIINNEMNALFMIWYLVDCYIKILMRLFKFILYLTELETAFYLLILLNPVLNLMMTLFFIISISNTFLFIIGSL